MLCSVTVTYSGDPLVLEAARGSYLDDKGPNDVDWIYLDDETIAYVLKDINVFFPRLKAISWYQTGLQSLTADDLKQFSNLLFLDFPALSRWRYF